MRSGSIGARRKAGGRKLLRIGLFGGTFDPIHNGHLAVARAARRRFSLDIVYFIPCGRPPHKARPGLSPFLHRYTMVALACAGEPRFLASLLEAGADLGGRTRSYSVDTVRRMRRLLGARARLYFLLGADAALYLPSWKRFRALRRSCEFIVADRPGFDLGRVQRTLVKAASRVHYLRGINSRVSATAIRRAAGRDRKVAAWVPAAIAAYIEKMALYPRGR